MWLRFSGGAWICLQNDCSSYKYLPLLSFTKKATERQEGRIFVWWVIIQIFTPPVFQYLYFHKKATERQEGQIFVRLLIIQVFAPPVFHKKSYWMTGGAIICMMSNHTHFCPSCLSVSLFSQKATERQEGQIFVWLLIIQIFAPPVFTCKSLPCKRPSCRILTCKRHSCKEPYL